MNTVNHRKRMRPANCCDPVNELPPLDRVRHGDTLAIFKALSDDTRLNILRLIAYQDAPICACDIVDRFDVSQPTIAHHLKVLREAGLIISTKRGVWMYYAVDRRGLDILEGTVRSLGAPAHAVA